jgi:uncharacterized membrane protein
MSRRSERNRARQVRLQQQQARGRVVDPFASPLPNNVVAGYAQVSTAYSGPIPPPELLREYEELCPGTAEQFIGAFVRQVDHRINLETRYLKSDRRRSWGGLAAGFVVAMTALIGGIWLVYLGHDAAGAAIGTTGLGGLVGTFIYGTRSQRTERIEKAKIARGRK